MYKHTHTYMYYMHEMAIVLKNTFYEMTYKEIETLSSPVTLEQ